jgi:hypothetical protein
MEIKRLEELERACYECAPGAVFVALRNDGVARIDPKDLLELIRSYRTLLWTKIANNRADVAQHCSGQVVKSLS